LIGLGLLPGVVVLAWAALLWRRGQGLRESLAAAAIDGAVWLVIGVELLSLAESISRPTLVVWWSIPAVVLVAAHRSCPRGRWRGLALPPTGVPERVLALSILALLLWAFVQAVLAPPNTIDALTYHLPRQVFWSQQHSVSHYPTNILRQLTMPPLAEFTGLNLLELSGGDRLHNLLQWSAMAGTLMLISMLVRDLGGGIRAQLLGALFFLTAPSAFVQASSCKNDLVVAFWLAAALLRGLRVARERGLLDDLRLGASFGLLALAKGTGLIFGVPVALIVLRRIGPSRAVLRRVAILTLAACVLNVGHWARNLAAFGSPYGPDAETHGGKKVINEILTPAGWTSVAVRNLAAELALPGETWNALLGRAVERTHEWLGLSSDDPRTTYRYPPYVPPQFRPKEEDLVAAPAQVALALLLPALLLVVRRRVDIRVLGELWIAGALGFALFCAGLKWQLWHPRLLFPLLVFFAPVAGRILAMVGWIAGLCLLAFASLLLPTLNFSARPLFGPDNLFVVTRRSAYLHDPSLRAFRASCEDAAAIVRRLKPRRIGLACTWCGYDYALQVYLSDPPGLVPRFSAFNAQFVPPGEREVDPDLVVGLDLAQPTLVHRTSGLRYAAVAGSGRLTFYVPLPPAPPGTSSPPSVPTAGSHEEDP
jgi:4-amino-4-deoxy-L-arabinose transferase-like glycosyltransferase